MSCIHFKFTNTFEDDKIKFEGLHISVADLKQAIIKQKNLKANLYTLKVIDSQSKKEYSNEQEMLPRNTSVIVSRVPLANAQRIPKSKFKDPTLPQSESIVSKSAPPGTKGSGEKMTVEELKKTADLANANATEEEKVMAMISQSGEGYDPSQYVWTRGGSSVPGIMPGLKKNPPPPSYICYRCGNRGHWIQLCPTNGDPTFNNYRYKRSMGTPSSQIVSVNENIPGAMLDRFGHLVVRAVDLKAVNDFKMKKLNPPEERLKELEPPPELLCSICEELMKDAVIIPCCGESYCYECIQDHLCENEFTCPSCKKENISPDDLAPNKALRKSAKNFQMKVAEDKSVAMASGTGFVKKVPISVSNTQQMTVKHTPPTQPPKVDVEEKLSDSESLNNTKDSEEKNKEVPSPKTTVAPSEHEDKETTDVKILAPIDVTSDSKQIQPGLKRPEPKIKSRSGSPATSVATSMPCSDTNLALKQSTLNATAIPMLSGMPLTSGLLPQTLGTSLAPPLGHQPLFPQVLIQGVNPSALPGQVGLLPQPRPSIHGTSNKTSSDPTKLDRLAAELLLNSAVSKKRVSPSPPPPLSIKEFYRHQKLLKMFAKSGGRRGSSESSSSRSMSTDSSYSSSSAYSGTKSRSRSPYHKASHRSRRRKHDRREKRQDISSDKRRKKKIRVHMDEQDGEKQRKDKDKSRRHHVKRKKHEDPVEERSKESRQKHHRHRSVSRSPEEKVPLEELVDSTIVSSPGTATTTPIEMEAGSLVNHKSPSPPVEESESYSLQRHKHKKKSKKKQKHHHHWDVEDVEPLMSLEREEESKGGGKIEPSNVGVECSSSPLEAENSRTEPAVTGDAKNLSGGDVTVDQERQDEIESSTDTKTKPQLPENGESTLSPCVNKDLPNNVDDSTLVPSQDSSCSNVELNGGNSVPESKSENEKELPSEDPSSHVKDLNSPLKYIDNEVKGEESGENDVTGNDNVMEESMEIAVHAEDIDTLESMEEDIEDIKGENKTDAQPKPIPLLTKDDMASIMDHLESVIDWRSLAVELRVPARKLPHIQQNFPVESLERVVLYWLESGPEGNRTWKYLADALKKIGENSLANRILRQYTSTIVGREEGEISDSEDEARKLPDLRETLASRQIKPDLTSRQSKPDLRETINSHKTGKNRKRQSPLVEPNSEEEEIADSEEILQLTKPPPNKKPKKIQSIASSIYADSRSYSDSDDFSNAEDDSSSSSSESDEELIRAKNKKASKSSTKHSSAALPKAKKQKSSDKYRSKDKERKEEEKEKRMKKRRHKHEHKHSSSTGSKPHKLKKSSKVERNRKDKKVKKHKKSSLHSERAHH